MTLVGSKDSLGEGQASWVFKHSSIQDLAWFVVDPSTTYEAGARPTIGIGIRGYPTTV
jgi:hypothetical protein